MCYDGGVHRNFKLLIGQGEWENLKMNVEWTDELCTADAEQQATRSTFPPPFLPPGCWCHTQHARERGVSGVSIGDLAEALDLAPSDADMPSCNNRLVPLI